MVNIWIIAVSFPDNLGLITFEFVMKYNIAQPSTISKSLLKITTKIHDGIIFKYEHRRYDENIRNLSAMGSRKEPSGVICLRYLAINPSRASVSTENENISIGQGYMPSNSVIIKTGIRIILNIVILFARV